METSIHTTVTFVEEILTSLASYLRLLRENLKSRYVFSSLPLYRDWLLVTS